MKRQLYMGGGIMNARPRQQFIFGGVADTVKDLGKKAARGIKDIVSSDAGKAALLAAATFKLGGGQFGKLFSGGPTGFSLSNLPGASLFAATGNPAQQKAVGSPFSQFLNKITGGSKLGKFAALGGLSAFLTSQFGLTPEQQEEQLKDPTTLKNYLRLYYKNLNPKAQEEDVEEFVETNAAEYTAGMGAYAVGGRVGFAEGPVLPPDPTQPVNPFGPKPGDFGIEEDIPIKMASNIENDKILEALFEKYLDLGFSPKEAADKAKEEFDRMSMMKTEGRGLAALGGRMNFDEGTPGRGLQGLAKMGMGGQKSAVIIGPDGKLIVVTEKELEEMLGGSMSLDREGIEVIERKEKAEGDTASDNAMQAAGIEGLPVSQNPKGVKELDLIETGGFIQPVGIKEKADDIPAMLSNNEFVFTADAVRGAGGGNVEVGAQRMYDMMKKLEAGGRV